MRSCSFLLVMLIYSIAKGSRKPIALRPLHSTCDHTSDCCIYPATSSREDNISICFVNEGVKCTDLVGSSSEPVADQRTDPSSPSPHHSMNGTAIENFVCVIFNVSFMNCTWHVGRTATEDTQYFLYWRPSKREDVRECQNYIKDDFGRHTGCRFQNVTIENKNAYFLVNGSRSGQNIQSYEKKILLYQIEKLTPPLNVSVNCTEASHRCSIWWQPPRTSHVKISSCFKYEIVIENKADADKNTKTASKTEEIIESNSYLYESFSSEKRYSVKIRATDAGFCLVSPDWGEWSTPVEFGTQLTSSSRYMLFLIPGLTAGLTLFLCMTVRAYLKKTSASVPQPRDPFHKSSLMDFQTEYMDLLKKQESEETIEIEEVMECK